MTTYYQILNVSESAPVEVIQAAHKALITKHHPDKGGNPKKAAELNAARDVLLDPQKRKAYDVSLAQQRAAKKTTAKKAEAPPNGTHRVDFDPRAYPPPYPGMDFTPFVEAAGTVIREVLTQAPPWLNAIFVAAMKGRP